MAGRGNHRSFVGNKKGGLVRRHMQAMKAQELRGAMKRVD